MWATFLQPLENGDYKVEWNIIGADGHPIEGEFSFSVNVPVTEEPAEEQIEPQEETKPQPNVEEKEVDTVNETKDEKTQQNKMPSYVIPSIIGSFNCYCCWKFLIDNEKEEIVYDCCRHHYSSFIISLLCHSYRKFHPISCT